MDSIECLELPYFWDQIVNKNVQGKSNLDDFYKFELGREIKTGFVKS